MVDPVVKKEIDGMSYYGLLERWRNAPVGDSIFREENGVYYAKVMQTKREEIGDAAHTQTSKEIG